MRLTANETKYLKKLKDKKYRKAEQLFLVEGTKLCEELKKSDYEIVKTISSTLEFKDYPNFVLADEEVVSSLATTKTPQKIVCIAKIKDTLESFPRGNSLILDNLQDPGNIGTLIRSASAFNFNDIYFINCADIYSEKVVRGSMGAIFKIKPHIATKEYVLKNKAKICDVLVGTDMKSKNDLAFLDKKRLSVVVGNEGNGVDKEILNHCDSLVTLKMSNDVESLNAGVAGSIIMYEIYKN